MIPFIIIFLICVLILASPLKVKVTYLRYKEENSFKISVGLFKEFILVFDSSKQKTKKKTSEKSSEGKEKDLKRDIDFDLICDIIKEVAVLFEFLKKKLVISFLKLHFHMGLGDPANTGIATGHSWSVLYNAVSLLERNFTLKKQTVNITPEFFEAIFETDIEVKLSIRVFYLLSFAVKLYKAGKKIKLI